jgi:ubiquitin-activating enzyme E1
MSGGGEIDEGLYSRQLYVMGHEAQRCMARASVLIVGLNGLGVETAKNVILAGVKTVTLLDNTPASWSDMSAQFYVGEEDLGKPRGPLSAHKLAALNPYVTINVLHGELTREVLSSSGFTAVVLIDLPSRDKQIEIADHCHSLNIPVMVADTHGVFGTIFCDFGPNFTCYDTTGENNVISMIANVAVAEDGLSALVTVLEETPHQLESGDHVNFTELAEISFPAASAQGTFAVAVKDRYSFEVHVPAEAASAGARITGKYSKGGYVNQVKQPVSVAFQTMSESIVSPGSVVGDAFKMESAPVLHVAFQALYKFKEQNQGELPAPGNLQHAAAVYQLALTFAGPRSGVDMEAIQKFEKTILLLALGSRGQVSPVAALLGGVLGQEILKACSGKFMPIRQWFYYDAVEALPPLEALTADDLQPIGCRYDGQVVTFGKAMQHKLASLKMFVVGAGAIGCEMLKNFAMMGVGCGPDAGGGVYVTDMDQIEKSNLSRQFLFRNTDINSPKSTTAVRAVKAMNPALNGVAYESKVGPDTEVLFNDDFFDSLACVCTALDNIEARLYVDQRCLFYRKPMLDSGTLGTKGSTQVVIPGKTENYGATRDPPEKSFPICTLKHFPNQIEHTIAWARDWFEEGFKQTPDDVNAYLQASRQDFLTSLANQQNMKLDTLVRMKDALVGSRPTNYADCLSYARLQFEDLFSNKIKQLLHNFPLDKAVVTNGVAVPFWAGAKKPPSPLEFDPADAAHWEFVSTVASLRALSYGLTDRLDDEAARAVLARVQVPSFRASDGVTIPVTEEEAKNNTGAVAAASSGGMVDIDEACNQIIQSLPDPSSLSGFVSLKAIDFDKDVDDQMRVIAACSNLRARNYRIPEADLHRSRGIAGKIMPAIATTTALVTGHICLELFKVINDAPVEKFMNTFSNLALPLFVCQEPDKPAGTKSVIKGKEFTWTVWDRIDINEPTMTLAQLISYLLETYGVELSMLSAGVSILYSDFMDRKKSAERQNMTLKDLVETVTRRPIPPTQRFVVLEVICNDESTGDEVEMPCLRFRLPQP